MKPDKNPALKLLIVDDDPEDRYLVHQLLKDENNIQWIFLESETGQKGLELCKKEKPDCILLDYILPDIDGLEFLSQLKSTDHPPEVIMLTGQGDETVAALAIKEGAKDYFVKNHLNPASLKNAILKCFREKERQLNRLSLLEKKLVESFRLSSYHREMLAEIQSLKEKLESMPGTDPVTGLSNRANMKDKLRYEKLRFERSNKPFSLITADIDDFQSLQETFGQQTVCQLLIFVGKMLDENCRRQDLVCRWGENRFVLLLPETDLNGATVLLEKFCKIVETEKFILQKKEVPFSMSFQAGVYNDPNLEIEYCIQQADECLF